MKLAAAVIIAGTLLSIGFCMETSRKETAKQLQELIRFLLFAGQEIEIRGSILEDVFTKASSITQGATKELVSRMAKRMAEGGDFLQEWSNAVNEVYRKMGWNEQESARGETAPPPQTSPPARRPSPLQQSPSRRSPKNWAAKTA